VRNKHNGGFSLVEVLVAIVLLGLIVIPICSSMLVAHRINAKAEALLQAELAVSSAAERYYAGMSPAEIENIDINNDIEIESGIIKSTKFPEVLVTIY